MRVPGLFASIFLPVVGSPVAESLNPRSSSQGGGIVDVAGLGFVVGPHAGLSVNSTARRAYQRRRRDDPGGATPAG
jgi:hypothetical protein